MSGLKRIICSSSPRSKLAGGAEDFSGAYPFGFQDEGFDFSTLFHSHSQPQDSVFTLNLEGLVLSFEGSTLNLEGLTLFKSASCDVVLQISSLHSNNHAVHIN